MTRGTFRISRIAAVLTLALTAVGLSGCTAFAPSYGVLDRDAEPEDALPDAVAEQDSGDAADLSSARLVGEHSGTSIWLLRGVEPGTVCVLAFPEDGVWGMGCGGNGAPVEMSGPAGHFVTVPDDYPTPDGATRVSDNVYALSP
ncbi:hypothetical protein [Microbacterium oxydans]|uniref:hypothetical protein n=1 Tax=Microbacterium oxydans TaxID=82380 RepID=UPI0005ED2A08|nr:hypothetical protein [Microbacterium oxydans]